MAQSRSDIKCILTINGDTFSRRIKLTREAYQTAQKMGLNKYFQSLVDDLGGKDFTYVVIN